MNVVYLDQNIVIGVRDKKPEFLHARDVILRLAETNRVIFPYSEIHLAESAHMAPDSQRLTGELWDSISHGYSFLSGKHIRSEQFKDVFHGRKTRFRARRFLIKERGNFAERIDFADPKAAEERAERLRKVVEYWASLSKSEIDGRIRRSEGLASARMVVEMLTKMVKGYLPSIGELYSEYNSIASDLSWEIRDKDESEPDPLLKAIAFMQNHFHEVPAIAIETAGLESLAEQFAKDNTSKRPVEKSQLDHDSNDLAALSNFVPYCDAGISDGNAVAVIRRAYKKLRVSPPELFTQSKIEQFVEFLEALPEPETEPDPKREIIQTNGRTLVLVPQRKDELVRRERFLPKDRIHREILPFGGLKVSTIQQLDWPSLVGELKSLRQSAEVDQGEATMFGGDSQSGLLFEIRIPFGMFDLQGDEMKAVFQAADAKT